MIEEQNQGVNRIRRVRPAFHRFQKVWRMYGIYKLPAIVWGHPIVRYSEENEFIEILLIVNGFCALRAVPSNFLVPVLDAEAEGWSLDEFDE